MLEQYDRVVGAAKIPLDIKNARNARQADGSILEYGLGKLCGRVSQLRKLKREERASERDRERQRDTVCACCAATVVLMVAVVG